MKRISSAGTHKDILKPVAECLTPTVANRILAVKLSPKTHARISDLAMKANEGEMSEEERSEYERIVENADLLGILKAMARQFLSRS